MMNDIYESDAGMSLSELADVVEGPTTPIRIVLADDQRLFRDSLAGWLNLQADLEVVSLAATGEEAFTSVEKLHPDVVLLDIRMPQMDGITALLYIKQAFPATRVLLLTAFSWEGYFLLGLAAGADGLLLKDCGFAELISVIRSAYARPLLHSQTGAQFLPLTTSETTSHGLTERELETVRLVARGQVVKEVARTLCVSEKTVRNHLSSIYRKLNIYDRSQIVIYALQQGLVALPEH